MHIDDNTNALLLQRWRGWLSSRQPPCRWWPAARQLPCCSSPALPASRSPAAGSAAPCCNEAWLAGGCLPHIGRPQAGLRASETVCSPTFETKQSLRACMHVCTWGPSSLLLQCREDVAHKAMGCVWVCSAQLALLLPSHSHTLQLSHYVTVGALIEEG